MNVVCTILGALRLAIASAHAEVRLSLENSFIETYKNRATLESDYVVDLPCAGPRTTELAKVPTRLADMPETIQARLINCGYAICDAGMRRWVDSTLPPPSALPYAGGV